MIKSKGEYEFVSWGVDDLVCDGNVLPLRTYGGDVIRAEDLAFLMEGARERLNAVGLRRGGLSIDRMIRADRVQQVNMDLYTEWREMGSDENGYPMKPSVEFNDLLGLSEYRCDPPCVLQSNLRQTALVSATAYRGRSVNKYALSVHYQNLQRLTRFQFTGPLDVEGDGISWDVSTRGSAKDREGLEDFLQKNPHTDKPLMPLTGAAYCDYNTNSYACRVWRATAGRYTIPNTAGFDLARFASASVVLLVTAWAWSGNGTTSSDLYLKHALVAVPAEIDVYSNRFSVGVDVVLAKAAEVFKKEGTTADTGTYCTTGTICFNVFEIIKCTGGWCDLGDHTKWW